MRTKVRKVKVRNLKKIQEKRLPFQRFMTNIVAYVSITYQQPHNDAIAVQNTVLSRKQGSLNTLGKTLF